VTRRMLLQVRRALGRKLSAVLSAVLVIYQLGSCAAYLIIVGDSFVPLLDQVRVAIPNPNPSPDRPGQGC